MKKLVVALFASFALLTSCNIGEDGKDGDAFLKLNWENDEPTYVNPNGAVPSDFVWDTFYKVNPGTYTINFEYTYEHSYATVVYPYRLILRYL